jgi:peptidoglycan/xylan/chitin deacetylase (PgdA/CDA1 family)
MWNVSTFDWQEEVLYHNIVERAAKRVASEGKKGRGAIILMHDGPTQQIKTAIAVKNLVGILQKDFKLTTVDN